MLNVNFLKLVFHLYFGGNIKRYLFFSFDSLHFVRFFLPANNDNIKGNKIHFQGRQLCQNCFCFPSEKGSILKGENLLP